MKSWITYDFVLCYVAFFELFGIFNMSLSWGGRSTTTAVIIASSYGYKEMVEVGMKYGGFERGGDAVGCAASNGHIEIIKTYKEWGETILKKLWSMQLSMGILRLSGYAKSGEHVISIVP